MTGFPFCAVFASSIFYFQVHLNLLVLPFLLLEQGSEKWFIF